jgi:16S rRNA (cytosine1402-N4)-methyltransferase
MMAGRGGGTPAADGGLVRHIPVLGGRAIEFLQPHHGGVYIDATFGAGGYSRAILAAAECSVIGIDRDQHAVAQAADLVQAAAGRLVVTEDRFSNLHIIARAFGHDVVDGVVLDLGVSSMQLDEGARGFSFRRDGPLDMRMGGSGPSAADVVRHVSERDLAAIVGTLGEERHARAVARAIVHARAEAPIETTGALAEIVARVVHARPGAIHPATRTFQALRMFVNEELGELVAALHAAERILQPGGRLVVVSFHSLEDRVVKLFFAARGKRSAGSRHAPEVKQGPASLHILTGRAVTADAAETLANPRARSAKLRAAERTQGQAGEDITAMLLPRLPSLADIVEGRRSA